MKLIIPALTIVGAIAVGMFVYNNWIAPSDG